jgi:DNA-binding Xre family transcriptional regulator
VKVYLDIAGPKNIYLQLTKEASRMYDHIAIQVQMLRKGVEIDELARHIDMSEATVRAVLKGADTRVSTLRKIATALGCPTRDFFLDQVESKPSDKASA